MKEWFCFLQWNIRSLDIVHSHAFIGIFKINVVDAHFVERMEHFPMILIFIVMITMNKVVCVQIVMSMSKNKIFIFDFLSNIFILVVNFCIEMLMILKNVIIYVISKRVYVRMILMRKDTVLKMVHIAHMLMVQMIYVNRFLIVEKYKIVI